MLNKIQKIKDFIAPAPSNRHFDQNDLDLELLGEPYSLRLLTVQAKLTKGPNKGESPVLACKWFTKTDFSIEQIEGVQGCYYQLSAQDVGSSVLVQVQPSLQDYEYKGMPMSRQIGPIRLESQTHALLTQLGGQAELLVTASSSQDQLLNGELKLRCSSDSIAFYSQGQLLRTTSRSRQTALKIIKKSANAATLTLSHSESVKLKFEGSRERDVLYLLLQDEAKTEETTCSSGCLEEDRKQSMMLSLSRENDQLTRLFRQAKGQIQQLKDKYQSQERLIQSMKDQCQSLSMQVRQAVTNAELLRQEHASSDKEELLNLRKRNQSLVNKVGQAQQQAAFLKLEVSRLKKQIRDERSGRLVTEQALELQNRLQLDLLKKSVGQQVQRRVELQRRLKVAELAVEKELAGSEVLSFSLVQTQRQLEETQLNLRKVEAKYKLLRGQKLQLNRRELQQAKTEAEGLRQSLAHLEALLQAQKSKRRKQRQQGVLSFLRDFRGGLQGDVQSVQRVANGLAQQVMELQQECEQLRRISRADKQRLRNCERRSD